MQFKQLKDPITGEVSDKMVLMIVGDIISCVPNAQSNNDWLAYQAWLDDGNEPLPADEE